MGPLGIESPSTQRYLFGALTLVFGPVFWWTLQKLISRFNVPGAVDAQTTFGVDVCFLFSACVSMNQAWAFKALVSARVSELHPQLLLIRLGVPALVLLCLGTGAFKVRDAVFGPQKESIMHPPQPNGFSLPDAFVLAIYGSFPLVTGFYFYTTLALWWSDFVALLGIQSYIEASSWIMVMEKGTFFFIVSNAAKIALVYCNGKNLINPLDKEHGIASAKSKPPQESSPLMKSIGLTYSWAMAYTLDMFWFDDMNGCSYDPERTPGFPKYCKSIQNMSFAIGITLLFVVLTFANSLTHETTWWNYYDKKLHSTAFPTIVGWAWASYVNSHLADLKHDVNNMRKHHHTSVWVSPAFYLATWAFLLAVGAGAFNLFKNLQRDLENELSGEAPAPAPPPPTGSEEGSEYQKMIPEGSEP